MRTFRIIRKMHVEQEPFINTRSAAELLCISPRTLQLWVKSGKVPYFRVEKRLLFRKSDILSLVKAYRP